MTPAPAKTSFDKPSARDAERVADLCRYIAAAAEEPDLEELAAHAGLSVAWLHRVFRRVTGVTPRAYAAQLRAGRLQEALPVAGSVTEAIHAAGFSPDGRFYAESKTLLGMTPAEFRAGGLRASIRFAVGQCSLGAILVAQSERGLCAILLGDDPQALVDDLQARFPCATLLGGDLGFEQVVATVVGFVEAPALGLDLPLDVRGTAFQRRVWEALRGIPPGSTLSYAAVAARMGEPRAVRAVAGACAANALAVAIPCHRVVRSDGGLSGYRWGIERKQRLLAREGARAGE